MQNRIKNRLPPYHRFPQFKDIIDALIGKTKVRVDGGQIELSAVMRSEEFERDGKRFRILLLSVLGEVYVDIIELKK
jgi:hypothetical protein